MHINCNWRQLVSNLVAKWSAHVSVIGIWHNINICNHKPAALSYGRINAYINILNTSRVDYQLKKFIVHASADADWHSLD